MSNCLLCATGKESLVSAVHSSKIVVAKRLRVDIAYLRDLIYHNSSKRLVWVPTKEQFADCMTKITAPAIDSVSKTLFTNSLEIFFASKAVKESLCTST